MNKNKLESLFFSRTRDFLDSYLEKQCSRSPNTIRGYRDALTVFRKYITDARGYSIRTFRFADCTRDLILGFLEYLQGRGYAPNSCNQRLAAIKAYLWYVADGDIAVQQTALAISHVPFIKVPDTIKETLNEECLAAILSAPGNTRLGIRDTAIMVILYDTAIRLNELLELKISDLGLDKAMPYLFIHGKGDKERIVPVSERTADHIRYYMLHYHGASDPKTEYLFYTTIHEKTNRMSPGNVERLINKYATQVRDAHPDMPEKVHPHMFRRTRATDMYQNNIKLELVSRILGHVSTQTTRIYARPSLGMIKNAMENNQSQICDEKPLWLDDEAELAKICGLR